MAPQIKQLPHLMWSLPANEQRNVDFKSSFRCMWIWLAPWRCLKELLLPKHHVFFNLRNLECKVVIEEKTWDCWTIKIFGSPCLSEAEESKAERDGESGELIDLNRQIHVVNDALACKPFVQYRCRQAQSH